MFDREGFKEYVGTNSGSSYVNGLDNIEKIYNVDIDEEIRKDTCAHLLLRIDSDKKKMSGNDRHNRQNWYSHLKKYMLIGLTQQTTTSSNRPIYSTTVVR